MHHTSKALDAFYNIYIIRPSLAFVMPTLLIFKARLLGLLALPKVYHVLQFVSSLGLWLTIPSYLSLGGSSFSSKSPEAFRKENDHNTLLLQRRNDGQRHVDGRK